MEAINLNQLRTMVDAMIRSCDQIVFMLRNTREQWHDAPYFLTPIMESCQKLRQTISQFRDHLRDEMSLPLDALHSILSSFQKVLNGVEKSAQELQPRGNYAADRNLWRQFRSKVPDSTLKNCSNELDKQNSSIESLVVVLKLPLGQRQRSFDQLHSKIKEHCASSVIGASRGVSFSFSVFEFPSRKPSYSIRRQAIEAMSVSSVGWLVIISLVCAVICSLLIPDINVKGKFQAGITGITSSGVWVIWLIEELIPQSASQEELGVALLEAATVGSLRDATALLKRGARCTVRDENLMTPLHLAASWGHCAIVKLLLSYKNKDWYAQGGMTPIHLAARYGHSKVVKLLISNGGHDWINDRADSPATLQKFKFPRVISHGKTFSARELAAIYCHENAVLAFPSTKKDDTLHAMSSACALGNQSMVETIWRHHKQRSYFKRHSNPTRLISTFHAPPLHLAVTSGNPALVAYLLERDFPVNDQSTAKDSQYSSPAHYAAITGSVDILYLLKSSGGAMTSLDFRNRTPLSYAVEHEHVQAVSLLVRQASLYRSTSSKDAVTFHLGSGHREHMKGWNVMNGEIRKILKQIGI
ncbi:ankyrin repeat and protein kinase domain-containing protein [Fusarium proliferatum]|uniref:Ankyrin repeat and protein kinase domain-containing protein n=1 Tax=Gibberella intermedia TaxID=948311 RepID=A0A365MPV3_GIBIN|nr:ankyrin repeat and protein kinase domain-containing protein [Fusarium proliferatum]